MAIAPLDRSSADVWDLLAQDNPERPILLDLMGVGVYANSVWDLVHSAAPFRSARPVLRRHLERGGYPPVVEDGLRQALARRA